MPSPRAFARVFRRGLPGLVAAALAVASLGCSSNRFDHSIHDTSVPRVSVIHRPLHPGVGEGFEIIARPEGLRPSLTSQVTVEVIYPGGGAVRRSCTAARLNPRGECVLSVPAGARRAGVATYFAEVAQRRGQRRSPGSYSFQIGLPAPPGPNGRRVFPLRVPLEQRDRMLQVLLVPDRDSFTVLDSLDLDRFTGKVEGLLYEGLLEDPAYRWRDDQIGFYATERVGVTTDYASGDRSRCGGNPWPGVAEAGIDLASEIADADALGVLHTRNQRDCAGLGATTAGGTRPHFSANADDPVLFQHELGHALFGLGDEYRETTASRQAPGGDPRLEGCCCEPGGVVGGEVVGPGGIPAPGGVCPDPEAPACGQLLDPACYPAGPACPPIASRCEQPNVFASRAECEAAVARAAAHPAVRADPVDGDCRLLCSPGTDPCPCTPDETVWILDRRTPAAAGAVDDDIMGRRDALVPAERHGPACVLCIEAELCMLWELGSDRSEAAAREYCGLP